MTPIGKFTCRISDNVDDFSYFKYKGVDSNNGANRLSKFMFMYVICSFYLV